MIVNPMELAMQQAIRLLTKRRHSRKVLFFLNQGLLPVPIVSHLSYHFGVPRNRDLKSKLGSQSALV